MVKIWENGKKLTKFLKILEYLQNFCKIAKKLLYYFKPERNFAKLQNFIILKKIVKIEKFSQI